MQASSNLLMIKPVNFSFNAETAVNNAFQQAGVTTAATQQQAADEFNNLANLLRSKGVEVTVVEDTPQPYTPDSIFPNNWVSFHQNGTVVLYPMYAANRRAERKPHVLDTIFEKFLHNTVVDLSMYEQEEKFLEGTGSMILDRENNICYACLSPRTHAEVVKIFAEKLNYKPIVFTATDGDGILIYHTNVMMCVADKYAVICLESVTQPQQRELLLQTFALTGKQVIEISLQQMNSFAGNMLQVQNKAAEKFLVMSARAYHSLTVKQQQTLKSFNEIIHAPLNTIEDNGGGSARCMLAEIFLPEKTKQ
jgi:hypothetical protein